LTRGPERSRKLSGPAGSQEKAFHLEGFCVLRIFQKVHLLVKIEKTKPIPANLKQMLTNHKIFIIQTAINN
jgi:hypothetical protein